MNLKFKRKVGCANNPENSLKIKIGQHINCGYSMSTIYEFINIEKNHTLYLGEGCMKEFCSSLREHATNILNFENKQILPLTKEELRLHQHARSYSICGERILQKLAKNKKYPKVRHHCHYKGKYRGLTPNICNLKVFHKGSDYDYHFTIKELANQFEGKFEYLGATYRKVKNFFCSNRKRSNKN